MPVPTPSPTPRTSKPFVLSEGDSISVFWNGNHTGIYAGANPNVRFSGRAVGGSTILNGSNSLEARFASDAALKPEYVTILIGANDLGDGTFQSADDWLNALWAYTAKWKALGAKVAVGTVLPICIPSFADYTRRHTERRLVANSAIRAAVSGKIDAVIDYAADPIMGPDAAACDRNLYPDGLHPSDGGGTGIGGQGKLAVIYAAALNNLLKQ
ncbi:SGNH/GDSL hydrolase family protein [Sphingomonas sp. M1-B02]|uniref:SGNH/GDSL hydrolase family protein n=1 Tax=Sphingomonas sp. M1-B02 TaxID=3114300 RepID=UPI00223EA3C4|nr:SGNH/GDSL hydrolase family protein [Sphingomonas sp. S6-11]UZK67929.1 SGNH/GDSL hydrolase family protein [Sphingomonas sp. S6-11]